MRVEDSGTKEALRSLLSARGVRWGGGLVARVSRVELGEDGGRDTLQHLLGEDTEQLPADVQGLEHGAVLVATLQVKS